MEYRRALHRVAVLTAIAIIPLMLVGAGVTSKGAGMAFPDWPTSDSHLLNPPGWLHSDAKLWEHGHRLIGWLVGILAISLAALSWRIGGWVRGAGLGVLFAIIVQGVLGGLRVREISTEFALIHGVWGQLCFCLACVTALITSKRWVTSQQDSIEAKGVSFFRKLCVVTTVFLFLQLVLGGVYRHFAFSWALAAHILWAIVVIMALSWVAMWAMDQYPGQRMLSMLARFLAVLVGMQLLLGGLAFLMVVMTSSTGFFTWFVPSVHVVVGALLLACMVVLTYVSHHVLKPIRASQKTADLGTLAVSS